MIEKLASVVREFSPHLTFAFNHSIPSCVAAVLECPIVVWDADSIQFFNDKPSLLAKSDRYYFFCFSRHGVENAKAFGAPAGRVHLMPAATSVRAEGIGQSMNISFIGTLFRNSPSLRRFIQEYDRVERDAIFQMVRGGYGNINSRFIEDRRLSIEQYIELPLLFSAFAATRRLEVLNALNPLGLHLFGGDQWLDASEFFPELALALVPQQVYSLRHNQDIYNQSKICLNINHSQVVDGYSWRVLDVMASNGCLLTSPTSAILGLFKGYCDLPTFETPGDAFQLASSLLADESRRREIVLASQAVVAKQGRWSHRFRDMEQVLSVELTRRESLAAGSVTLLKVSEDKKILPIPNPAPVMRFPEVLAFGPRFAAEDKSLHLRVEPDSTDLTLCLKIEAPGLPTHFSMFPTNGAEHLLVLLERGVSISFSIGAEAKPIEGFDGIVLWALRQLQGNRVVRLCSGAASVQPIGDRKPGRRLIRKSLRSLGSLNLGRGNCYASESAAMVLGLQSLIKSPQPKAPSHSLRIGVVVHIHYPDTWAEIAASLLCMPEPFGLIVTITRQNPKLEADIRSLFPFAFIRLTANVGRDVRPFFELLDDGYLDQFDIVCKIHGKKTLQDGKASALGKLWLRSALIELIAGDGRLSEVVDRFKSSPRLGQLGTERLRIPNNKVSHHDAWAGNKSATLQLAEKLGFKSFELDFFAGTMFWIRPEALGHLRSKAMGDVTSYAPESGRSDGALEHSLERLLSASVRSAGFEVGALNSILYQANGS